MLDIDSEPSYPDHMRWRAFALAMAGLGGFLWALDSCDPGYTCQEGTHIVQPGDTVWSVAEERCEGDIASASYYIRTGSDLGPTIYPGDRLIIPKGDG